MKKKLLTLVATGLILASCTGPFALTKKLHNWQTSFDGRWADELAFLGCVILPVYGLTTLGDAIIFNSIEFWSGDNPIGDASISDPNQNSDLAKTFEVKNSDGETLTFQKNATGAEAYNEAGELVYTSKTIDGEVVVYDASGKIVKVFE